MVRAPAAAAPRAVKRNRTWEIRIRIEIFWLGLGWGLSQCCSARWGGAVWAGVGGSVGCSIRIQLQGRYPQTYHVSADTCSFGYTDTGYLRPPGIRIRILSRKWYPACVCGYKKHPCVARARALSFPYSMDDESGIFESGYRVSKEDRAHDTI